MEVCLVPARVSIFPFIVNLIKVLLPIFTLCWRVNFYVSRQGKSMRRRNMSTVFYEDFPHFDYQLTVLIVNSYVSKNHIFPLFSGVG